MHGSTRDRLEELLAKGVRQTGSQQNAQEALALPDGHLQHCPECALDVNSMREQAEWIRHLRAPEEFDPAPGFYARVLQCIEERAKRSIWYGLVYSPAGKRLAYASLSLALALGMYVIAAEQFDRPLPAKPAVVEQANAQVFGDGGSAQQRDAVLVNFASYGSDAAAGSYSSDVTGPAQP